jgi:hypothetical protein
VGRKVGPQIPGLYLEHEESNEPQDGKEGVWDTKGCNESMEYLGRKQMFPALV